MTQEFWDRLEDETPAPWAAFQVFLHMSTRPRRLTDMPELTRTETRPDGYSVETLMGWSADFEWFARAAEWDEHLERARRRGVTKVVEREGEKMAKDRIRLLGKARTILEAKLDEMLKRGGAGSELNGHATIRLLREFNLLTRLEEGEATERVEEKGTDLSKLSDDELAQLEGLLGRARGG